ncbi:hypothetical protein RJ639_015174 [Escallonia herrerae]|uniref:Enhancer of mRNA-decapping protein 4 n=1 Tax=Escallonia herrerae TaxID=1293975 RepID=A0AA88VQ63_9ASTE|nr:hypothetical protein RJ639_015174 [Escallonia herrerae]
MASPGNPNQPGGQQFEMLKFFKPSPPNPITSQNPNTGANLNSPQPPYPPTPYPPSASYPPPTATGIPYSYAPQTSPFHPQFHHYPPQQDHISNLHHQRSIPFPAPPLQPPPPQNPNPNPTPGARLMALLSAPPSTLEIPQQPSMPMPPPLQPSSSGGSDFSMLMTGPMMPSGPFGPNVNPGAMVHSSPMRMPSSKLPKGRHLIGNQVVYDVDVRLQGEVQPQLEVTPITKYGSDPGLVVGRQIAVNKTYICYGLKLGAIRVLNINTALRSLLKGLAQRVTDMAFFAEDVHLLASASVDGRVYVWKITEGPDEEDKPQITGKIVIAIQIVGEGESVHPRVCWHCHKQEVLVVGIGRSVLRIDTTKVGKGEVYSADDPLKITVEKMIDGVQFVGNHDGEVTDLSMCQWMTTRLVSASVDGTIKIWEDRKLQPIAVLRPHEGLPVNSVTFLTAPHRPDHIILITGGPLNREIKLWALASEEGWLLPSDSDSWHCTQTLELKSSALPQVEEAFFNQVVALSQAGLLLLANAKKNAIYAVHLEYGPNPASTRMDYISEFTVTMPILSFTGTSDLLPHGEQIVQVYCVQTQAIQQYALDLSQCLPPPLENMVFEKSDSSVSRDATITEGLPSFESSGGKPTEMSLASTAPRPSIPESSSESALNVRHPLGSASVEAVSFPEFPTSSMESKPISVPVVSKDMDVASITSPPLPLSPRLSRKLSGLRSPSSNLEAAHPFNDGGDQKVIQCSVEMDTVHRNLSDVPSLDDNSRRDEKKTAQDDVPTAPNQPIKFKHPTHLVTPSEILMATSSSEINQVSEQRSEGEPTNQDAVISNDTQNVEVEVKVVGETGLSHNDGLCSEGDLQSFDSSNKEKTFYSQASDLGIKMARECGSLPAETSKECRQFDGAIGSEAVAQPSTDLEEVRDSAVDSAGKLADSAMPATVQPPVPASKGKKKGKNAQGSSPSSPSPSVFNSTDSSNEPGVSSSIPSAEASFSQIQAIQEMLSQLTSMQKEMQKQMTTMVSVPVTKEGRRLEAALGRSIEKAVKANTDALWARFQEENAKHETLAQDRTQQLTSTITNCMNKDFPAMLEKSLKKEVAAVGPAVARAVTPAIEKTVSTAIAETFQRGVGDKAVNQLEKSVNSKLEATVARQIQSQFQTSGKQALQDALKSSLEASVVPAFEMSCKAMFEQVDASFQKGMFEHTSATQQQFESMHSPLALALRVRSLSDVDAISSASSMTQSLSSELADGQRKLIALAIAGASSNAGNPLVSQLSNGPLGGFHEKIEAPLDPTKELSRLIYEHKYEEAFTAALQRSDVSIVSWLCSQVDLQRILMANTMPLSQGVLLSLLQQLACDISKDSARKLMWMQDVAAAIKADNPMIAVHVRPIFEQVYQIVNNHLSLPTTTTAEIASIRIIVRIIEATLRNS